MGRVGEADRLNRMINMILLAINIYYMCFSWLLILWCPSMSDIGVLSEYTLDLHVHPSIMA